MRDTRVRLNTHPITGRLLLPLGRRADGRLIWPVLGGSEPPNQPPPGDTGTGTAQPPPTPPAAPPAAPPTPPTTPPPAGDRGYPPDTPIAEMTVEQQAAYWKAQSRKHEAEARRRADYDAVKARADQFDALDQASRSEHEKAVDAARKEADEAARAEERGRYGAQLVAAELRAALAGRVDPAQRDALIEAVNPARFLDDKGQVDPGAVTAWVDKAAPAAPGGTRYDGAQGGRTGTQPAGVDAGRAAYAAAHPPRKQPTST